MLFSAAGPSFKVTVPLVAAVLLTATILTAQVTSNEQSPETKKTVTKKTTFNPVCTTPSYPTPPPAKPPAVDSACGLQGSGGAEANQNAAKNNFCASGEPKEITLADLTSLQTQVNNNTSIPFGESAQNGHAKGPTTNRAPLQALGEGTLVRMQGYILMDRQEGEESVNCGTSVPDQPAYHDIHIELVGDASTTDECSGVVSEMIPHHRPDSWTAENVSKLAPDKIAVRVTGQLFFDSSHFPCNYPGASESDPKRVSLWEIHPIYMFEVCPGDCSSGTGWVPLDVWLNMPDTGKPSKKLPTSRQ